MKTILQLFSTLLFLSFSFFSNAQTWNWASSFGSATDNEEVTDIVRDNQGNLYITGIFNSPIITPIDTIISNGNTDIFIAKFDSSGTMLWIKNGGGVTSNDDVQAITVDANGNVFITGQFQTTANFSGITVSSSGGYRAIFVAKYDTNGNIQWVRAATNISGSSSFIGDNSYDIEVDANGNSYITGIKSSVITVGSITVANPNVFSIGNFIIKLDPNGVPIFGIPINPGIQTFQAAKLKIVNNELYVLYINYTNSYALEIRKYTLSGTWITTLPPFTNGGVFQNSETIEFVVQNDGSIILYADFQSSTSVGGNLLNSGSGFNSVDMFLAKFNSAGTFQWVNQLGGGGIDGEGKVALDSANNIYVSGFFNNTISIDTTVLQAVGQDMFVAKFNPTGSLNWAKTAGSGNSKSNTICVESNGNTYVAGRYNGNAQFDNITIMSNGSTDAFLAKLGCEPQRVSKVLGDTLVCLGTQNYQAINLSNGSNFLWTLSGGGILTNNGNLATINWTQTGIHTITVAQVNDCGAGESFSFEVIVKDVPVLPIINGDTTDCLGSATYNVTNNFDSDTYNWTVSGGGNLFPIGNTAIVNWAVTGTHTLSVSAANLCGIGPTGNLTVDISEIPLQPSPITGNTNVCQSTQTYTIPQVSSVEYTWSLSSGGTITSTGNTATINWTTAGTHTLSVTPFNECGIGSVRSILVTVTEVPQQPSTVVGNLTVCQGLQSYSVIGNSSTSYNWTISGGGNISAANNNATVNWQNSGTYTMTVTPSNVCGIGTPRTVTVTVLDVPNQPTDILGIDTVCIGSQNYSVAPQSGVNFNWQLSSGGTVLPSNNLATINWTTPGTYTITVTPSNSCGTGLAKSKLVFVKNTNAQITTITGENEPCLNIENYGVPSIPGLGYDWNVTGGGTITELGNSAFVDWNNTGIYTLSVSTSDGCTNSLTVSVDDVPTQPSQIFGDTTVCLGFYNYSVLNAPNVSYTWTLSGGGILTQSGNAANVNWTQTGTYILTATPSNDCGLGMTRNQTITVLDVPNTPSTISTTTTNDTLACLSSETYLIAPQSNVDYNWSLSGNGIITQNANAIDVNWLTPSIDNEILVTTSNICGTSLQQNLLIDVLDIPQVAPIQGDDEVCLNTVQVYTVPLIVENNYVWTLSSGGTLTIINDTAFVSWQTTGTHTLTVSTSNICGSGQSQTMPITVKDVPTLPIGFVGNTNACQTLEGYSITPENNVNYNWNLSSGGSLVALNNAANVNWTIPGSHVLTITPNNECGIGTPLNQTISVQNIPASPSAITGIDSTCLNTTNNFSTSIQSGVTYTWSLSNGGVLISNANNATVNWNTTGNEILSVSATNTCGTSIPRTKNITILDVPTSPTISGVTDVCLNDTESYIATSDATSYIWTTTGGTNNGNSVNWTTLGSQTLTATPTNFCGNGASTSTTVTVKTVPNITQDISGDSVVCPGIMTYSLPQISGVNYTWSISGGGTTQPLNSSININWITSGIYTITAIPSNDCGNGNIITKQITVRDAPTQPSTIQGLDTICTVSEIYSVIAESGITYNWTLGSGGIITPLGNNTISILWTDQGTHTITVTPQNICGTLGTPITKTITVLISPQLNGGILGAVEVCNGETENYSIANTNTNWNYNWVIDNGNTIGSVNNNQITIDFNNIGTTILSLTIDNQCGVASVKTIVIEVEDNMPSITGGIQGDTLVCRNSDVVYSTDGNSDFEYTWILDNGGSISNLQNSSIVGWNTAGLFDLGVYASNNCGIGDTIFKTIEVVNPLPTPQITLINDTLFSSNTTISTWFYNELPIDNITDYFLLPTNGGIYNVASENICGTTALSNDFGFGLEGGLSFYPNPTSNNLTLRVPDYLTWYSITAFDQKGRIVLPAIYPTGTITDKIPIDITGLAAGLYLFEVKTDLFTVYRRVFVVR